MKGIMPTARSRKKMPAKKTAARPAKKASATHPLMKSYFHKEQADFFSKHKNMNTLLLVFLVFVTLFFVVVYLNKSYYMM
jgi:hypothetical protein